MRLYLSSLGLGDRPEALAALCRAGRRAAIVPNALDHAADERRVWLERQSEDLAALGFSVGELDLRRYFAKPDALAERLRTLDLVWAVGGNTFNLRRAMKRSGFDALIARAVAADALVYGGFSAGAVVCAPSLRGLDFVDPPDEVPPGYDTGIVWDGLGILPFALAVHVDSGHPESPLAAGEIAYYEANGIPFRKLRDGEVLVVDGDRQVLLG